MPSQRYILLFVALFMACNSDKKAPANKDRTTTTATNAQSGATPINETQAYADKPLTDTLDRPICMINGAELVYDRRGCTTGYSDSISVYYKAKGVKKLLFNVPMGDNHVDQVSCFKEGGNDFIYVGTEHTSGHSEGFLYYLNTAKMKAYEVTIDERKTDKIVKRDPTIDPDTLEMRIACHLTKNEKNELGGGVRYRSESSGLHYYNSWAYTILKIGENKFVLELKDDDKWEIEE